MSDRPVIAADSGWTLHMMTHLWCCEMLERRNLFSRSNNSVGLPRGSDPLPASTASTEKQLVGIASRHSRLADKLFLIRLDTARDQSGITRFGTQMCFRSSNSRDLKSGSVQEAISLQAFGESSTARNEDVIPIPQMANTKKTAAHTSRLPPASIQIRPCIPK